VKPLTIVISFDVGEQVVLAASRFRRLSIGALSHQFPFGSWIGSSRPRREPCGNRRRRIGYRDRNGGSGRATAFAAGWPYSGLRWSIPPACGHASPSGRFCGSRDQARRPDRATLRWLHVGEVGEPNLIGPLSGEFLAKPVGGGRQIVMAVGGAYPKPPRRYRPNALMTHETFDAATARRVALRA